MRVLAITSLVTLSSAATFDLSKRKGGGGSQTSGFGGSKRAGSTIAKSGTTVIYPGHAGGSSYGYTAGECYDQANNPVVFVGDDDKKWIQINQNETNWSGSNPGQNNLNDKVTKTNHYFDIYDAYYNGSISLQLIPPEGAPCEKVVTQAIPYSYFRIGQISRSGGKYTRKDYDNNLFYFRIGRSTDDDNGKHTCQFTPKKMFASFESSNNGFDHNQVWTLNSKLNGDSYEVSGNITSPYASDNNYFNVLPFASSNTTNDERCPSHFYMATLNKDDQAGMNGTVSNTTAVIQWEFIDSESKWHVIGVFNGSIWDKGAKLDGVSQKSQVPLTVGQAPSTEEDDDESYVERHETGIIAGSVIGGVVVLALIGAAAFFLFSRYKKRHYKEAKQVDHDDAWAMEDHHDEREFKDGAGTSLKPVPSQQNLLGHGIDTSYDAHRAPSPDPDHVPPYSEAYTPLKN